MVSSPYFSLAVLFVGALLFGLTPLALAWLWGRVFSPWKPNAIKNAIYECGLESKGDAWVQFRSAYYLYAIIFLIFDVEAVFMLPWAVIFRQLPKITGSKFFGFNEMIVYLGFVAVGLFYVWKKGILDWSNDKGDL